MADFPLNLPFFTGQGGLVPPPFKPPNPVRLIDLPENRLKKEGLKRAGFSEQQIELQLQDESKRTFTAPPVPGAGAGPATEDNFFQGFVDDAMKKVREMGFAQSTSVNPPRMMDEDRFAEVRAKLKRGGYDDAAIEHYLQNEAPKNLPTGVQPPPAFGPGEQQDEPWSFSKMLGSLGVNVNPDVNLGGLPKIPFGQGWLDGASGGPPGGPPPYPSLAGPQHPSSPDYLAKGMDLLQGALASPPPSYSGQPSPHAGAPPIGPAQGAGDIPPGTQAPGGPAGAGAPPGASVPPAFPPPPGPHLGGADPMAGLSVGTGQPYPAEEKGGFLNELLNNPNLMELGLRLMASAEPQPGAARGPSLFGAIGQAGLGTMGSQAARTAAGRAYGIEKEKIAVDREALGVERGKIASNQFLLAETQRLRQETAQASNEIARYRADLQARGLEIDQSKVGVSIANWAQNSKEALQETTDYLLLDEPAKKQALRNIDKSANEMLVNAGLEPLDIGGEDTSGEVKIGGVNYRVKDGRLQADVE